MKADILAAMILVVACYGIGYGCFLAVKLIALFAMILVVCDDTYWLDGWL